MNRQAVSVLIVEDEAMTAMYMKQMLKRKGYNVLDCVSSGEMAVDYTLKSYPDLVLMDIRLAGKMDGIDAVTKIVAQAVKPVQFIFTTGYSDQEIRDKAMIFKPLGFFTKPVNLTMLVNTIESFFTNPITLQGITE